MSGTVSVTLPRDARAPGLARQALSELEGRVDPSRLADVRLLVTELVTNGVKYGGDGPVRLNVSTAGNRLRAEIVDQGKGFVPRERARRLDEVGGWGLHLVERLTDRWGTHSGSTHVWFEIDL
jgi:anti-sigma regulatory factor (Ser/Thr protein kinase)